MKESISYSFLLNIVITFIFVAFAIVIGSLSYYRAFKANSIISETIEKYEGYNCISKSEIAQKLNSIGYNTPFNVNCTESDENCEADTNYGYKVVSYNLDFSGNYVFNNNMNSEYICDSTNGYACKTNKHYQYGIYTYMYVDMPVISQILRIPFISRTSTMYEFRNIYAEVINDGRGHSSIAQIDTSSSFEELFNTYTVDGNVYVKDVNKGKCTVYETIDNTTANLKDSPENTAIPSNNEEGCQKGSIQLIKNTIDNVYAINSTTSPLMLMPKNMMYEHIMSTITGNSGLNYRGRAIVKNLARQTSSGGESFDSSASTALLSGVPLHDCGYIRNYAALN